MKVNEYEIKENIVFLKVPKKDGSIIDTKINVKDLEKVLEKGVWFAEWNKDFNNYLVQTLSISNIDGKIVKGKQTLHSFILGVNTKAPVIHLNGDTLDNRGSNLQVYNQNAQNDYEIIDKDTISIILRDKYGREKARAIIDKADKNKIITEGYTWVYYMSNGKAYAVANTPEGRIFLHELLIETAEDMVLTHINYNTLDNRKANLKNVSLNENIQNSNSVN